MSQASPRRRGARRAEHAGDVEHHGEQSAAKEEKASSWDGRMKPCIMEAPRPTVPRTNPAIQYGSDQMLPEKEENLSKRNWRRDAPNSCSAVLHEAQASINTLMMRVSEDVAGLEESLGAARSYASALEAEKMAISEQASVRESSLQSHISRLEKDLAFQIDTHAAVVAELDLERTKHVNFDKLFPDGIERDEKTVAHRCYEKACSLMTYNAALQKTVEDYKKRFRRTLALNTKRLSRSSFRKPRASAATGTLPGRLDDKPKKCDAVVLDEDHDAIVPAVNVEENVVAAKVISSPPSGQVAPPKSATVAELSRDPGSPQEAIVHQQKAKESKSRLKLDDVPGLRIYSMPAKKRALPLQDEAKDVAVLSERNQCDDALVKRASTPDPAKERCVSRSPSWHADDKRMKRSVSAAEQSSRPSVDPMNPPPPPKVPQAFSRSNSIREVRANGFTGAEAKPQIGPLCRHTGVRSKQFRLGLQSFDCEQCRAFYEATGFQGNAVAKDGRASWRAGTSGSRHRFEHAPTNTPDGFWDLSFPDPPR